MIQIYLHRDFIQRRDPRGFDSLTHDFLKTVKKPPWVKPPDTRFDLETAPVPTVEAGGMSGNLSRSIPGTRRLSRRQLCRCRIPCMHTDHPGADCRWQKICFAPDTEVLDVRFLFMLCPAVRPSQRKGYGCETLTIERPVFLKVLHIGSIHINVPG
jgi:hypothetical protein